MARPVNPDAGRYHLTADPDQLRRWIAAAEADDRDLASWIRRACDLSARKTLGKTAGSEKSDRPRRK